MQAATVSWKSVMTLKQTEKRTNVTLQLLRTTLHQHLAGQQILVVLVVAWLG